MYYLPILGGGLSIGPRGGKSFGGSFSGDLSFVVDTFGLFELLGSSNST